MKVRSAVTKMCPKCRMSVIKGRLRVFCENKKHKQRQG